MTIDDVVLVVELDAVLDALLVERLQDHVAGPVGGEARAAHRRLAEVAGMAAEAALVDLAVGRAVERQAHVLELDDRLDRLARQDLRRILVDQVVATLDGVEHVPFPVVLFLVAERGTDAALGGAGVGASRIELGQHGALDAAARELERGPQTGAAGADDDRLVFVHGTQATRHRRLISRATIGQRHDDLRAQDEQHEADHVQQPQRAGAQHGSVDVVEHDGAHAQEARGRSRSSAAASPCRARRC